MGCATYLALGAVLVALHIQREVSQIDMHVGDLSVDAGGPAFSLTYWEAREKFRKAVRDVPELKLSSFPIKEGSPFTIDIAHLKRAASQDIMVHLSGVHGVEGYAGSAVQIEMLRQWAADPSSVPKKNIVIVHAFNPYGMANNRRWNENNVDLNRNTLLDPKRFEEMKQRDPNIGGYMTVDSVINPREAPTLLSLPVAVVQSAGLLLKLGMVAVKRALVSGQYHDPTGICYGGKGLEASHVIFRDFMKEIGADKLTGTAILIDLHTGLGPKGVDTFLLDDSSQLDLLKKVVTWDPKVDPLTRIDTHEMSSDVYAGYELTQGMTSQGVPYWFKGASKRLAVCQEFGTVPPIFVGVAMVVENQAYQYAPEQRSYWGTYKRSAFYVQTTEWRTSVMRRGLSVFKQAANF